MKGVAVMPARTRGDFFARYKEMYLRLSHYFGEGDNAATDGQPGQLAGNLLTQIAFLYFLQGKGLLRIPTWQDMHNSNYYNEAIRPLCEKLSFIQDNSPSLYVPNHLLRDHGTGIMDIFDEYHFTIDEGASLRREMIVVPEMLGEAFENLLETSERKHKGTFYTPREIVQYMCRESLAYYLDDDVSPDQQDDKLFNIKICDPAIGSGAFAIAMLHELVQAQLKLLPYLSQEYLERKLTRLGLTNVTNNKEYTYSITNHAIRESIYGLDIDATAIDITRMRLWLTLAANERSFNLLQAPGCKIIKGNALVDLPSHWKQQFDIVIGNPPYGIYQRNKKEELAIIKKISAFNLAKGQKLNAFELFLCLAPQLSKPGTGIISMVFQNSFLGDNSSKLLRQFYLQHKEIIKIDSFPERDDPNKRVFRSAKMSVCILFARNTHVANHAFTLNIWSDRYFEKGTTARIDVDAIFKLDPRYYSIPSASADEYKVLQHLSQFDKLSSIAHCFEGEINLTNHKPYLSEQKHEGYFDMIKGAAIHRWHLVEKMSQGVQQYVSPEYVEDFIAAPKSRHYTSPRLVLQGITGVDEKYRLKFALLHNNIFCGNSANYLLFHDPSLTLPYLAIMNAELQNWFFKKFSTNSNVNGYEIDNLPVVNLDPHEAELLKNIAEYMCCISTKDNIPLLYSFFETLNNAVNYELFFKDDLQSANLHIIQYASLQPLGAGMNRQQKLDIIQSEFDRLNNTQSRLRSHLEALETIEAVRVIRNVLYS
ncbi:MAG TPA: N-6 DNA methylase [Chitinophagaceae bacterium]